MRVSLRRDGALAQPLAAALQRVFDALPLDRMWPDDRLWLPRILAGATLRGDFLFRRGELLAWTLEAADFAD